MIRLIAILMALVIAGLVIMMIGDMRGVSLNPIKVYVSMADGAFGTSSSWLISKMRSWITIRDCMILTCIAIGLAPAFKMRFWNIGAEGQMLVGAIGAAFFMINFAGKIPQPLLFLCMVLAAILAGGLWGFIPGFFKAKWNTNETLFTLMMNYIAIQLTSFSVAKWEYPPGSNSVGTINGAGKPNTYIGWIGNMFKEGYDDDYMFVVAIVLVLAVLMYIYLRYTKQGYEIAVVGESENTARYSGIRVPSVYMRTMAISGAVCGFAGFLAVAAVSRTISIDTAGGRGFTAIIVAWLAKFNTFTMILISALIVFLDKGASQIASKYGINEYVSHIITGIILFFLLGSEFFIGYKVKFRHKAAAGQEVSK
jgi:simple sugar transport system permease protein